MWTRRWPEWAPAAAGVWGVLYAAVEVTWAVAEVDVPWSPDASYPPATQLLLAALAVAAGLVSLATRRPRRGLLAPLVLAIAVFTAGMASLPAYVVTLASFSGVDSATGLAQVLASTVGVVVLVLVAVAYRRRSRGTCPRCGRAHPGPHDGPLVHPPATVASGRTRGAVYLLMCGLLPWAAVKTVWTLGGDALGVSAEGWRAANAGESAAAEALSAVGVDVTVLAAAAGIFLLLGLMYPWGQVFPRWTLVLAGRRVPRLLPLLPAWLAAVGLSAYGAVLVVYAPLTALGVLPRLEAEPPFTTSAGLTWMVAFGGLAFGGLGFGLLTAARSYAARTRPVCAAALDRPRRKRCRSSAPQRC
jgi:D-alanyl-D-alanine dipeptidase